MMSRRKGAAGEREAAAKLNEVLGTHLHRGRQYCGGPESPDVAGDLPGLHLEVKRVEALRLYPSLEQAARDAATDEVPAVMHRMNKKPWVVIVYADDLIRLLDVVDACRGRSEVQGDADELFRGLRPPPECRLKNQSPPCPAPAPLLEEGLTPGDESGSRKNGTNAEHSTLNAER